MAETAITPTDLALNVESADILDAGGTAANTPTDGWSIPLGVGYTSDQLLLKFLADASGDTVTVVAGANPPAKLAGLGNLSIVLAASDVRYIVVDGARFLRADGTILATCVDAGTTCKAFRMPAGMTGGTAMA
jgi:hypothetical protein